MGVRAELRGKDCETWVAARVYKGEGESWKVGIYSIINFFTWTGSVRFIRFQLFKTETEPNRLVF